MTTKKNTPHYASVEDQNNVLHFLNSGINQTKRSKFQLLKVALILALSVVLLAVLAKVIVMIYL